MIKEAYCSFEVAKLLKEKGFTWPCHYTYHGDITSVPFFHRKVKNFNGEEYSGKTTEWVSCPTLQMAMKWLREEKNILIYVYPVIDLPVKNDDTFYWQWDGKKKRHGAPHIGDKHNYESFEEAVEAALKYCLENLI